MTHAISGAVLARATAPEHRVNTLSLRERTIVGFIAGGAPDADILIRLWGQVAYLEQHRAETHSLLLLPAWAWVLAIGFALLGGRRHSWKAYYGVCFLGLGIHILGDLITSYGTQILAPLSNWAPGFNTTFIIDPWFSAILVLGLLLSLVWRPRLAASLTLVAITAAVLLQYTQYRAALAVGIAQAEQRGLTVERIEAYPQALSWFNWKVIISEPERHTLARFNLLRSEALADPGPDAGFLRRLHAAYPPVEQAVWQSYRKFGDGEEDAAARTVWAEDAMQFYHWFADAPALYAIETVDGERCVWFRDLRFQTPGMRTPFTYGMCRSGADDWQRYRRTADGRERLR
nr:metal-dependent hydrolase [Methylonatrum kenyense]